MNLKERLKEWFEIPTNGADLGFGYFLIWLAFMSGLSLLLVVKGV